jgi:hypothetical protein
MVAMLALRFRAFQLVARIFGWRTRSQHTAAVAAVAAAAAVVAAEVVAAV